MSSRLTRDAGCRPYRSGAILVAAVLTAVLALAGLAVARTFTLQVDQHATVKNATKHTTSHVAIVTNSRGFAVYWLTGDSQAHPKCTSGNGCFRVWPPVTAASAKALSKASAISGKLTGWTHGGITQAVLNGRPLYTFTADAKKGVATGAGIVSFGGTWHVELAVQGTQGLPQGY
jgi:predicted lipoprotein with Yx(FWY)xxD motif